MLDTSRVNSGTVRHLQEMEQGVANLTSQVWKLLVESGCGFTFTAVIPGNNKKKRNSRLFLLCSSKSKTLKGQPDKEYSIFA